MRSLDYFIQKVTFVVLGVLGLCALFSKGILLWMFLALFFFGVYHIIHYFFYLAHKLSTRKHVEEYMVIYPGLVALFFTLCYFLNPLIDEPLAWILFVLCALGIGFYYFYCVHEKNLNSNFRKF